MWGPAIIKKDDDYFLFFGGNDFQIDDELGGIGVAKASNPEGPYKDHLGKPLISKIHNGAQPIDQFVFFKDKGESYMFDGGWQNFNVAKLNNDFTGFKPFENGKIFKEVNPEGYVEGPFMCKRNGKYYFMCSEGGWTCPEYSVAYAIADSPTGPFKRIGMILQQDSEIAIGLDTIRLLRSQVRMLIRLYTTVDQKGKPIRIHGKPVLIECILMKMVI